MKGGRYFMQKKEQMQSLRHRVFKEHQGQCDRSIVSKEESGRFEITEEKGEGVGPRLW